MSKVGRGLNRARILRAALTLVDEDGIDALSMRNLGERLGVQAMSLYRHVRDKDDLLDGLQGAVLAEMEMPRTIGAPLAERVVAWARALRHALVRHPKTIPLFTSRAVVDPEALVVVENVLASLTEAGLDDEAALGLYQTILALVLGFSVLEATPRAPVHLTEEAQASPDLPTLQRMAGVALSTEHEFEAGLRTMAAGINALGEGALRRTPTDRSGAEGR